MSRSALMVAGLPQKPDLEAMMPQYLAEMAAFDPFAVLESTVFVPDQYFDAYWTEDSRYPFLIMSGERVAGFSLVRLIEDGSHSIAEFYILPPFRHEGLGTRAALEIFEKFSGRWRVAQMEANRGAQNFWRKVIGEITNHKFEEVWSEGRPRGPMQVFEIF